MPRRKRTFLFFFYILHAHAITFSDSGLMLYRACGLRLELFILKVVNFQFKSWISMDDRKYSAILK